MRLFLLIYILVSSIGLYGMNRESCCNMLFDRIIKMTEKPDDAIRYARQLNCDIQSDVLLYIHYPNANHISESLALSLWKRKKFHELYQNYSYKTAIEILNKEIYKKIYLQDIEYQQWIRDKTLRIKAICGF